MVNRGPEVCVAFLLGVFAVMRYVGFRVLKRRMNQHSYELSKLDAQGSLEPPKPDEFLELALDVFPEPQNAIAAPALDEETPAEAQEPLALDTAVPDTDRWCI